MAITTIWRTVCHQFHANRVIAFPLFQKAHLAEYLWVQSLGIHTCFTTLAVLSWQHSFYNEIHKPL